MRPLCSAAWLVGSGVQERGYTMFAFAGATYVAWVDNAGTMRLTRACP